MNKIIYLLKNDKKEILMLVKSLQLLSINLLTTNNYPIFILHDDSNIDFNKIILDSGVEFKTILINFNSYEYTKNINDNILDIINVTGVDRGFDIGYRNMCRFYSYGMYELDELKQTKYYLRLDCDSYFTDKIEYDIFEFMEKNNLIYGYNMITTDNPIVSKDLWELSKEYSTTNKVLKIPIDDIKKYNMFYTNFEIAKFDWFKSSDYKEYFSFIDKENGIYKYRWGDAIIKYLGIEMFLEDNRKYKFDIPYKHGNIFNF
jgi:mannosyltransferase